MLLKKRGILEDSAVSVDPVYEDGEPVAKILKLFSSSLRLIQKS